MDAATASLMQKMYKNLAKGMSKDAALQAAKIAYLNEAKGIAGHPCFLVAFHSDWR